MRVIVRVPSKGSRWTVSWPNHFGYKRKSVRETLSLLDRVCKTKEPVCVRVRYADGYNESMESDNRDYLNWITTCFLESYLDGDTIKQREKRYLHEH